MSTKWDEPGGDIIKDFESLTYSDWPKPEPILMSQEMYQIFLDLLGYGGLPEVDKSGRLV